MKSPNNIIPLSGKLEKLRSSSSLNDNKTTNDDNLIFYYTFRNINNVETDQTININNNVIYNKINGIPCATFDGNSFIYTTKSSSNIFSNVSNKLTCFARFKVNDKTKKHQTIISCTESGGFNIAINGDDYNGISFYLYANGSYLTNIACNVNKIIDNDWNCIALCYNGNICQIYLNNEKVYSANKTGNISFSNNSNVKFTIGAEANTNISLEQGFVGSIASVRIYNKTLTENQIIALSKQI